MFYWKIVYSFSLSSQKINVLMKHYDDCLILTIERKHSVLSHDHTLGLDTWYIFSHEIVICEVRERERGDRQTDKQILFYQLTFQIIARVKADPDEMPRDSVSKEYHVHTLPFKINLVV